MSTTATKPAATKAATSKASKAAAVKPATAAPANPAEKPVDPVGTDESGLILPMAELGAENAQADESYVANPELALDSIVRYLDAGKTYIPHAASAAAALATGAKAWMDFKSSILLGDGVTPDWAANSNAYSKAFQARKRQYLLANNVDAEDFESYHNSLTTWVNRNRFADEYIAQWIVDHTVNLGAIPVGAKPKDPNATQPTVAAVVTAAVKESKIPQPVRLEMQKHFEKQVSKGGNRLAGFKVVPKQFGVKPPAAPKQTKADSAGHQTPSGLWEKLRLEVSRLAPEAAVNELRYLATALSDAHLGEPGAKPKQPAVDADGAIANKEAVVEGYRLAATLLITTADVLEGMDGASKDNVATYRYQPEK